VTGRVSWRADNIHYKKNEVFLDVIEQVNLLVSATGTVLRSEVNGRIQIKAQLSGMPELRLGLNDRIDFSQSGTQICSYPLFNPNTYHTRTADGEDKGKKPMVRRSVSTAKP